ncbi:MAG: transposase [Actinomycetota bacterium]|nr:transposase [Actinomycetota bacterium]
MPQNFKPCDRSQRFLLSPDMREWLPPDHLAFFIFETTEGLDLGAFYRSYRADGWGRAAFEPRMMVALVLYAFAVGERSTRGIERRCVEDVAFRVITANETPDHSTIARFINRHREALGDLFRQIIGVCVSAGLVRPGVVAIDGTKMAANASQQRNLTEEELADYSARVFDEFDRVQAEEDALYGDRRGDEMPEFLRDPDARRAWINEQLEAQKQARADAPPDPRRGQVRVNTTDPDSRVMKTSQGYLQGYNAQAAATEDQIVVAAEVTNRNDDRGHFRPLLEGAQANLRASGTDPIETALADTGYFGIDNITSDFGCGILIAPVATRRLDEALAAASDIDAPPADLTSRAQAKELERFRAEDDHRIDVLERVVAKQMTGRDAAKRLGLSEPWVSSLKKKLQQEGPDAIRRSILPRRQPPPRARDVGLAIFSTPGARETYAKRSTIIEPIFGQTKEARGMRKFLRRGLAGCNSEWLLMMATHNLRKAWRATGSPSRLLTHPRFRLLVPVII